MLDFRVKVLTILFDLQTVMIHLLLQHMNGSPQETLNKNITRTQQEKNVNMQPNSVSN